MRGPLVCSLYGNSIRTSIPLRHSNSRPTAAAGRPARQVYSSPFSSQRPLPRGQPSPQIALLGLRSAPRAAARSPRSAPPPRRHHSASAPPPPPSKTSPAAPMQPPVITSNLSRSPQKSQAMADCVRTYACPHPSPLPLTLTRLIHRHREQQPPRECVP